MAALQALGEGLDEHVNESTMAYLQLVESEH